MAHSLTAGLQDLLRAAEKALASGLGDWHLQSIQDISPEFQQHVLMGALGPEALKHKHRVPEPQILHIYGLLHRYCTGFQQEVEAAVAGAEHREQLLASIWTAFAQLWDECVQVSRRLRVENLLGSAQQAHSAEDMMLSDTPKVLRTQHLNCKEHECHLFYPPRLIVRNSRKAWCACVHVHVPGVIPG